MNQTVDQLNTIEGERGLPSVNEARRSNRGRYLLLIFLALFLVAMVALVFFLTGGRRQVVEDVKTVEDSSAVPAKTFAPEPKPALPGTATVVPVVASPAGSAVAQPVPATDPAAAQPPPPVMDKASSALMAFGGEDKAPALFGEGEGGQGSAAGRAQPAAGGGPLAGLLAGTETPTGKARILRNRDFLLAKGAFIDCALQTRLDSTVPGMTTCVVTRDIASDNGRFVLIEKGSTVSGEYQSNMRQGMARIYVLWTRVKTPNGVVVNLDSPGADALGGAGLPGYIDNHFWQRFGGAMLLSLVDDAARYAVDRQRSSSTVQLDSTSQSANDMASIALENTINIPPTLYKNQGERVGIYVARDLDFSGVYRAEVR